MKKWNRQKLMYEPYCVPEEWNCKTYSEDMEELINCPHCGKQLEFGKSYCSFEIHTEWGFGFGVCEKCYTEELQRELQERKELD